METAQQRRTDILASNVLFGALSALAQDDIAQAPATDVPFYGAEQILIHTTDSSAVALKKMARTLVLAGIKPAKTYAPLYYYATKTKPVGRLHPAIYRYMILASREPTGTLLTITGTYTVKVYSGDTVASMYWVRDDLPPAERTYLAWHAKQCFRVILPVAQAYPGGHVAYAFAPIRIIH
jgi:hypothetical protein